jgi:hypothetical protein
VDVVGEAVHIGEANVLALGLFAQVLIKGGTNGGSEPGMPLMRGPDCVNPNSSVWHEWVRQGLKPQIYNTRKPGAKAPGKGFAKMQVGRLKALPAMLEAEKAGETGSPAYI